MTIPNALNSSPSKKPINGPAVISTEDEQASEAGTGAKNERGGWGAPVVKKAGSRSGCAGCCGLLSGLILASFVAAAVFVYRQHGVFDSSRLYSGYHDGDQILASRVDSGFSSLLCQTYQVKAWSDSADGASFYLTDGPAKLKFPDTQVIVISDSNGLRSFQDYDYAAFYLLPGSLIEASACMSIFNEFPTVHAEVLVIKGNDHFLQWQQDSSCTDCVTHRVRIASDQLCEVTGGLSARYDTQDADTYYVVITRQRRSQDYAALRADVTLKVTKTVYDVSQAKERCLHASGCTFNLTYNALDDVIVEFPFQNFAPEDPDNFFTSSCGIRTKFFLIIFVLIPASLIFLLLVLSCICCIQPDRRDKQTRQTLQQKKAETKAAFATATRPPSHRETPPPV